MDNSSGIAEANVVAQDECGECQVELRKASMEELLQEIVVVVNSAYQVCRKHRSDMIIQENEKQDTCGDEIIGYEPWEEDLKKLIESSQLNGLSEYGNLDIRLYDIIDATINYIIDNAAE